MFVFNKYAACCVCLDYMSRNLNLAYICGYHVLLCPSVLMLHTLICV